MRHFVKHALRVPSWTDEIAEPRPDMNYSKDTAFTVTQKLCNTYLPFDIVNKRLTLYFLVPSADDICKQSGARSGPTKGSTH